MISPQPRQIKWSCRGLPKARSNLERLSPKRYFEMSPQASNTSSVLYTVARDTFDFLKRITLNNSSASKCPSKFIAASNTSNRSGVTRSFFSCKYSSKVRFAASVSKRLLFFFYDNNLPNRLSVHVAIHHVSYLQRENSISNSFQIADNNNCHFRCIQIFL